MPIIDVHAHLVRGRLGPLPEAILPNALEAMQKYRVSTTVLMPPPRISRAEGARRRATAGLQRELDDLADLSRTRSQQFRFAAGGSDLNPTLHDVAPDQVTSEIADRFRRTADAIVRAGAAAFGEMAAEHLSSGRGSHPYESTPPDHPLLLLLAEIAAGNGLPIELHMEAVPRDMPMPEGRRHPPNPPALHENLTAFERLLGHARDARIVWAHAGWDLTGMRTTDLMRELLSRHANLYMSIKIDPGRATHRNAPFATDGTLRPEWLAMLREFPDRFVIGSDQFFDEGDARLALARQLVAALPPDIASRIASENALRVYRLPGVVAGR